MSNPERGGAAREAPVKARASSAAGGGASAAARRQAAVILEVLAGARTPAQAAQALEVSLPRYYQLEARALAGLVEGCIGKPPGRQPAADREVEALRRERARLERELARQQALVRLVQRGVGVAAVPAGAGKEAGKKRRRRPAVRALRAAARLRAEPEAAAAETAAPAPPVPAE
jgi:hypothetical protein